MASEGIQVLLKNLLAPMSSLVAPPAGWTLIGAASAVLTLTQDLSRHVKIDTGDALWSCCIEDKKIDSRELAAAALILYAISKTATGSYPFCLGAKRVLQAFPRLLQEGRRESVLRLAYLHARLGGLGPNRAQLDVATAVLSLHLLANDSGDGPALFLEHLPLPDAKWTMEAAKPMLCCMLAACRCAVSLGMHNLASTILHGCASRWFLFIHAALSLTSDVGVGLDASELRSWLQQQRMSLYSNLCGYIADGGETKRDAKMYSPKDAILAHCLSLEWLAWSLTPALAERRITDGGRALEHETTSSRFSTGPAVAAHLLVASRTAVNWYLHEVGARLDADEDEEASASYELSSSIFAEVGAPVLAACGRIHAVLSNFFPCDPSAAIPALKGSVGKQMIVSAPVDNVTDRTEVGLDMEYVVWTRKYADLSRRMSEWEQSCCILRSLSAYAQGRAITGSPDLFGARFVAAESAIGAACDAMLADAAKMHVVEQTFGLARRNECEVPSLHISNSAPGLLRKGVGILQRELQAAIPMLLGEVPDENHRRMRLSISSSFLRASNSIATLCDLCAVHPLRSLGAACGTLHDADNLALAPSTKRVGPVASSDSAHQIPAAPTKARPARRVMDIPDISDIAPPAVSGKKTVVQAPDAQTGASSVELVDWWLLIEQAAVTLSKQQWPLTTTCTDTPHRRTLTALAVASGVAARCRLVRVQLAAAGAFSGKKVTTAHAHRAWRFLSSTGLLNRSDWLRLNDLSQGESVIDNDDRAGGAGRLMNQLDAQHHLRKAGDHLKDVASVASLVGGTTGLALLSHAASLLLATIGPMVDSASQRSQCSELPALLLFDVCSSWERYIDALGASDHPIKPSLLSDAMDAAALSRQYATLANIWPVGLTSMKGFESPLSLGEVVGRAVLSALRQAAAQLQVATQLDLLEKNADSSSTAVLDLTMDGNSASFSALSSAAAGALSHALLFLTGSEAIVMTMDELQKIGRAITAVCLRHCSCSKPKSSKSNPCGLALFSCVAAVRGLKSIMRSKQYAGLEPRACAPFSAILLGMYRHMQDAHGNSLATAILALDASSALGEIADAFVRVQASVSQDDVDNEPDAGRSDVSKDISEVKSTKDMNASVHDGDAPWCLFCAPSGIVIPWACMPSLDHLPIILRGLLCEQAVSSSMLRVAGRCNCIAQNHASCAELQNWCNVAIASTACVPTSATRVAAISLALLTGPTLQDGLDDRLLASVITCMQTIADAEYGPLERDDRVAITSILIRCRDFVAVRPNGVAMVSKCMNASFSEAMTALNILVESAASKQSDRQCTLVQRCFGKWLSIVCAALLQSSVARTFVQPGFGLRGIVCALNHLSASSQLWARAWRARIRFGQVLQSAPMASRVPYCIVYDGCMGLWEGAMELAELLNYSKLSIARGDLSHAAEGAARSAVLALCLGVPISTHADSSFTMAAHVRHVQILCDGLMGSTTKAEQAAHGKHSTAVDLLSASAWAQVCTSQAMRAAKACDNVALANWTQRCKQIADDAIWAVGSVPNCHLSIAAICRALTGDKEGTSLLLIRMEKGGKSHPRRDLAAYLSGICPASTQPACLLFSILDAAVFPYLAWFELQQLLLVAADVHCASTCADHDCLSHALGSKVYASLLVHAAAGIDSDCSALQAIRRRVESSLLPAQPIWQMCRAERSAAHSCASKWAASCMIAGTSSLGHLIVSTDVLDNSAGTTLQAACSDSLTLLRCPRLSALAVASPWLTTALAWMHRPKEAGGCVLYTAATGAEGTLTMAVLSGEIAARAVEIARNLKRLQLDSSKSFGEPSGNHAAEGAAAGGIDTKFDAEPDSVSQADTSAGGSSRQSKRNKGKNTAGPSEGPQGANADHVIDAEAWWRERYTFEVRLERLLDEASEWIAGLHAQLGDRSTWTSISVGGSSSSPACVVMPHIEALEGMKVTELRVVAGKMGVKVIPTKKAELVAAVKLAGALLPQGKGKPDVRAEVADALQQSGELASLRNFAGDRHVLILDDSLRSFPWENSKGLDKLSCTRLPTAGFLAFGALACKYGQTVAPVGGEPPSCSWLADFGMRLLHRDEAPKSVYYAVNISGDLPRTQATVVPALYAASRLWRASATGVTCDAKLPAAHELTASVHQADFYLYGGHGAGESMLPRDTVSADLLSGPPCWLMGCSSGRQIVYGCPEPGSLACGTPQCAPISYLQALCPLVAACLWDVTDKDIDRFTVALLQSIAGAGPMTSAQYRKSASEACKLPAMVGASVVFYGFP